VTPPDLVLDLRQPVTLTSSACASIVLLEERAQLIIRALGSGSFGLRDSGIVHPFPVLTKRGMAPSAAVLSGFACGGRPFIHQTLWFGADEANLAWAAPNARVVAKTLQDVQALTMPPAGKTL
jgi:hypothetical protein